MKSSGYLVIVFSLTPKISAIFLRLTLLFLTIVLIFFSIFRGIFRETFRGTFATNEPTFGLLFS